MKHLNLQRLIHNGIARCSADFSDTFIRYLYDYRSPGCLLCLFWQVTGGLNSYGSTDELFEIILAEITPVNYSYTLK